MKNVSKLLRKLRIRHSRRAICFPRKSKNMKKSLRHSKMSFS